MGLKYVPALDGLRALAVLMVLGLHAGLPGFGGGAIGVDVFFVLSGYLITSILLTGPRLGDFYARRLRRIVPALLLLCSAYAVAAPFIPAAVFASPWLDLLGALTFTQDYVIPAAHRWNGLGHTWSLAVEMQFYLLWPFVVLGLRRLPRPIVGGLLASLYVAIWLVRFATIPAGWEAANFPAHTHCSGLVLGAILAFFPSVFVNRWPMVTGGAALLGLGFLCLTGAQTPLGNLRTVMFDTTAAELCAAVLITALAEPSALSRAFAWEPFRTVGVLSYGIYLWHFPFEVGLRDIASPSVRIAVGLITGLGFAAASYYTVEAAFRRPATKPRPASA